MNQDPEDEIFKLRNVLLNKSQESSLPARFEALFSLKIHGKSDKKAIDALAEGFCDDSELLKHEIAYVLGQTQNKKAIIPLEKILRSESQETIVRHEAAEALGALNSQESLPLLKFLKENDPSEIIRQTCDLAIQRIEWENSNESKTEKLLPNIFDSIDPAPPLPEDPGIGIENEVKKLSSELINQELPLFYRYRVMFRLRNIGTDTAIDALAQGFKDPSALFRHEIAYVFGQLCSLHSIPYLTNVLCNQMEEAMVRHEAAEALGSIGIPDVRSLLNKFVHDKERIVRESCIIAVEMCKSI
ncbi:hypothetical protein T552_03016 [Pneumocystis carinii B80]|uniref:Deoxyhypusine hydroxylase n=1 Tax=Pneumocystis carinii (strain B80) TaxID=1408658 RepID=A0A0W4ZCS9_PNEC8|nr:hypothetical protein T552_03016 [Pneumocystis carinii B80]KTW26122.1 hypothetical protein T552_03016 [Pneumocystis carinii B80]